MAVALQQGALKAVRVCPLGDDRHLAKRLDAVTAATAASLAVTAPLSGLAPASAWIAVVVAIPSGPLIPVIAGSRGRPS